MSTSSTNVSIVADSDCESEMYECSDEDVADVSIESPDYPLVGVNRESASISISLPSSSDDGSRSQNSGTDVSISSVDMDSLSKSS